MTRRFEGGTALATGTSRGIGMAIARQLVFDGARVVVTGRNQKAIDRAVAELGGIDHAVGVAWPRRRCRPPGRDGQAWDRQLRQRRRPAGAVVKTRFAAARCEGREDEVAEAYLLKRLGAPQDIGSVVAFQLSGEAAWVAAQLLVVDGGPLLTGGL
ncbi:SDR family oxidoreductase [Micromonospora sp. NBC_01638]|uniref:SDR family oxidoreductase n=1 Tax=Micromonospora sp. NBC_01638 TaxID=2975982 RepID=UPI00386F57D8|nr:SDR family oxidoreductase [Micromonospora sp. NBC_01638]